MNSCEICGAEFNSFVNPVCESELKQEERLVNVKLKIFCDESKLWEVKASMKRCYERIEKLVKEDVLQHELPDRIRKESCILPYEKIKIQQKEFKRLEKIYWKLKKDHE